MFHLEIMRRPGTNGQTHKLYQYLITDSTRLPAALAKFKHMVLAKRDFRLVWSHRYTRSFEIMSSLSWCKSSPVAGKARHSAPATFPEIIRGRAGNSNRVPQGYTCAASTGAESNSSSCASTLQCSPCFGHDGHTGNWELGRGILSWNCYVVWYSCLVKSSRAYLSRLGFSSDVGPQHAPTIKKEPWHDKPKPGLITSAPRTCFVRLVTLVLVI